MTRRTLTGVVDLESQLSPDHPARIVWAFVAGSDLSAFYTRIKARDDLPGRPASDPAVLLAVWLYATFDDVGSARAIARLCSDHAAYRWLCGGVAVNHDMLSAFRRDGGALLDGLLTRSLTGLVAEGLVPLDEAAIDGTKMRARVGHSSMAGRARLTRLETLVAERVRRLRAEVAQDASDGAFRPARNVQVATSGGDVVGIEPTDRRNDTGMAPGVLAQIARRCGRTPRRLPADATAMTSADIAGLAETHADLRVYSPLPKPSKRTLTAGLERNRRSRLRRAPEAVPQWRACMQTDAGQAVYRRRKLTELVHARMKNCGLGALLVHGLDKVRVVCLMHALANNLMTAHRCRGVPA